MGRGKTTRWGRVSNHIHDCPKMRQNWKGNSFERFIIANDFEFIRTVSGSHRIYQNSKGETISCKKNMNAAVAAAYIKKYNLK